MKYELAVNLGEKKYVERFVDRYLNGYIFDILKNGNLYVSINNKKKLDKYVLNLITQLTSHYDLNKFELYAFSFDRLFFKTINKTTYKELLNNKHGFKYINSIFNSLNDIANQRIIKINQFNKNNFNEFNKTSDDKIKPLIVVINHFNNRSGKNLEILQNLLKLSEKSGIYFIIASNEKFKFNENNFLLTNCEYALIEEPRQEKNKDTLEARLISIANDEVSEKLIIKDNLSLIKVVSIMSLENASSYVKAIDAEVTFVDNGQKLVIRAYKVDNLHKISYQLNRNNILNKRDGKVTWNKQLPESILEIKSAEEIIGNKYEELFQYANFELAKLIRNKKN